MLLMLVFAAGCICLLPRFHASKAPRRLRPSYMREEGAIIPTPWPPCPTDLFQLLWAPFLEHTRDWSVLQKMSLSLFSNDSQHESSLVFESAVT